MKNIFALLSIVAAFTVSSSAQARCDCREKIVSNEHAELYLIVVGHGPAHETIKVWYYRIENGNDKEMRQCQNLLAHHSSCK